MFNTIQKYFINNLITFLYLELTTSNHKTNDSRTYVQCLQICIRKINEFCDRSCLKCVIAVRLNVENSNNILCKYYQFHKQFGILKAVEPVNTEVRLTACLW